jgi:hypothetical protein
MLRPSSPSIAPRPSSRSTSLRRHALSLREISLANIGPGGDSPISEFATRGRRAADVALTFVRIRAMLLAVNARLGGQRSTNGSDCGLLRRHRRKLSSQLAGWFTSAVAGRPPLACRWVAENLPSTHGVGARDGPMWTWRVAQRPAAAGSQILSKGAFSRVCKLVLPHLSDAIANPPLP